MAQSKNRTTLARMLRTLSEAEMKSATVVVKVLEVWGKKSITIADNTAQCSLEFGSQVNHYRSLLKAGRLYELYNATKKNEWTLLLKEGSYPFELDPQEVEGQEKDFEGLKVVDKILTLKELMGGNFADKEIIQVPFHGRVEVNNGQVETISEIGNVRKVTLVGKDAEINLNFWKNHALANMLEEGSVYRFCLVKLGISKGSPKFGGKKFYRLTYLHEQTKMSKVVDEAVLREFSNIPWCNKRFPGVIMKFTNFRERQACHLCGVWVLAEDNMCQNETCNTVAVEGRLILKYYATLVVQDKDAGEITELTVNCNVLEPLRAKLGENNVSFADALGFLNFLCGKPVMIVKRKGDGEGKKDLCTAITIEG